MDDELLTLTEFAKQTRYGRSTVYNKISSGELTEEHGLVTFPSGRHRIDWAIWQAWTKATQNEFLTCQEFAKRAHYKIRTIWNKISTGELCAENGLLTMPGGHHRFDWSVWQAWLARRRERGATTVFIGKCKRLACSQVFTAANKRQEYCSPRCAGIERTARRIERDPGRARVRRHQAYIRKVGREKGLAAAKHVRTIRSRLHAATAAK